MPQHSSRMFVKRSGKHAVRVLATALAVTAVAPAALSAPAAAVEPQPTAVSRGVEIPEFYDPPATLPDADGALVRSEPLRLGVGLSIPGVGSLPGTATRVMYKTTDNNGSPAAVTGAYVEPFAAWRGEGERPLVVVAPGTMGQGDQCSASLGLERPIVFNGKTVSVGYEDIGIYRLLARGVAVMVTDYVGLGTTDRLHTYVDRVDGGHAVLDAARAASQVSGASVTSESRVALYGYSQGGGATGSASELASTYAPDVNLVGAYVGAPPADLRATAEGIDGSALVAALGWTINGLAQSNPELQPILDENLNEAGQAALEDLSTACIGDGIFGYPFQQSKRWTNTGESLDDIIEREPTVQAIISEQKLGNLSPQIPVRVATGTQDDIVPHAQARQLAVDWCAKGAEVTYKPVILPNLGDGLVTNHLVPLLTDQTAAVNWVTDLVGGAEASSNCASLPRQP
ncbi:dienelactone hydrolase [Nocardioides luteus]|uniref:Triacylglycerol lipase n=1 Tax=Nocardioides luteus TaxID=1844 RepID=A0ABQ5SZR5_9ACTN|nr:alpha/beta fold hydrolase [Nocardioides luteus]MDR7310546.1 dienelactone hydrolase [Nocardioides luteus]GGR42097.1 triacylglycerol lipase [Nocardioides luteus]GLJ69673.1 triacylglycerol lipase [Nocardioides luteus]